MLSHGTDIPTLAVKTLASYIKMLAETKNSNTKAGGEKSGINKKRSPHFFFARTSLIKLKKMGAVDIFSENFKKDGCSGHLF